MNKPKWEWDGYPKHFCCSTACRFHMATKIGNIVVSTLGDMHHKTYDSDGPEDIGLNRKYETMTFPAKKAECKCCEWQAVTSKEMQWSGVYNDARAAREGHYKICRQVEKHIMNVEKHITGKKKK